MAVNATELYGLAIETFGSKQKAESWLNQFHPALGDTPLSFARSEHGLAEVKKILNAIAWGGVV